LVDVVSKLDHSFVRNFELLGADGGSQSTPNSVQRVAVILRSELDESTEPFEQAEYAYKDPITEFILCLYVKFDFQKAQVYLEECEKVLENDFFLRNYTKEFIENARQIIFETFCRIHQCISISRLAEKLNMNEKEAERWIVNLIKNARLDAKIDTKRGHVVMSDHATNAHQQVIEKTKHLQVRTSLLSTFIDRRMGKEKGSDVPQWAMKDNRNKGKNNGERRSQWRSHQQ
jgi:translation initiation factor 3 subunit E